MDFSNYNNYDLHSSEGFRRVKQYLTEAERDMQVNQARQTAADENETSSEVRHPKRPLFVRLVSALTGKA